MTDALFETLGDGRYRATELARGPWDRDACHAGAPSALLAGLLDTAPALAPMRIARLTYDILRPVPLAEVAVHTEVVREGKRVALLEATMTDPDGTELVRCRAARIRTAEVAVPVEAGREQAAPQAHPDDLERLREPFAGFGTGFWDAVDVRPMTGQALGDPGPGSAWFHLTVPIAEGVETTPTARVAAAGDYGNGIAPPLDIREHLFINPDLTIHLHREPVGAWVALDSNSVVHGQGSGLTTSTLFDERSRIGTALQSLFIAAR